MATANLDGYCVPIEARNNLLLTNSIGYAARCRRYFSPDFPTLVPFDVYRQQIPGYTLCHARLTADVDLSKCHKFLWSARHGAASALPRDPSDLEVFAILTCVRPDVRGEAIQANILFPGAWALQVWNTEVCLWHGNMPILKRSAACPHGIVSARHPNLDRVFGDFCDA